MDKRVIGVIVLVAGVSGGILLMWQVQAAHMKRGFMEALANGRAGSLPMELRGKVWTNEELSSTRVIKLDRSSGPPRALERWVHTGGGFTISNTQYAYQATITNSATGIQYVFGYARGEPGGWRYVTIHPDSARQHLEQRLQRGAFSR